MKYYFRKIKFVASFKIINCFLKHLIMLKIPPHIFSIILFATELILHIISFKMGGLL